MCGIFGTVNGVAQSDKRLADYFFEAMQVGQVRGRDGAGMFQIQDGFSGEIFMDKHQWSGNSFILKDKGNAPLLLKAANQAFLTVGHHRAATVGKIDDASAHPFLINRDDASQFIGVHNGTLNLYGKEAEEAAKYRVDSEYLMYRMATEGIEETLKTTHGAVATVCYDTRTPSKFYMYTNGQRPLHFAFIRDNPERMLIASEAEMLFWLATRNKISLLKDEVYACKSRRLYTFDNTGKLHDYGINDIGYPATVLYPTTNTAGTNASNDWRMDEEDEEEALAWWRNQGSGSCLNGRSMLTAAFPADLKKAVAAALADEAPAERLAASMETVIAPSASTRRSGIAGVTQDEYTCLKESLEVKQGTEVLFEGDVFWPYSNNPNVGVLSGTVIFDDKYAEIFTAEVRNITEEEARMWVGKAGYARALGAYLEASPVADPDDAPLEFNIICSKPRPARAAKLEKPVAAAASGA